MSVARMWGPAPDVREVAEHRDLCGGGDRFAPWLVREAAVRLDGIERCAEVLGVVWLAVAYRDTPDAFVERLLGGVELVGDSCYEWCALSQGGMPMPRRARLSPELPTQAELDAHYRALGSWVVRTATGLTLVTSRRVEDFAGALSMHPVDLDGAPCEGPLGPWHPPAPEVRAEVDL